ncbi:MAG: hypothetical protein J6K58_14745 [Lachnospiraceae bacterium]|nr:hypothetical protein [Lachnospiraceae bacterium]
MNRLKAHLDENLKEIKVNTELRDEILQQTVNEKASRKYRRGRKGWLHSAGIAAGLLAFFLTSVTVAGAKVPMIQKWIHHLSPQLAAILYPIEESCEKEGIRLTVVAGVNDQRNGDIYFTIQDTEGEGRTAKKVDFMDSAGIDGSSITNVEFLSYDEESQTACYVLHESGERNFENSRNTFHIRSMMVNKEEFDWYDTCLDLADLAKPGADTASMDDYRYGGGSGAGMDSNIKPEVLKPDVTEISLGDQIDFVTISNIGIVGDTLHIQTKWDTSFDNHGELWLLAEGEEPGEYEDAVSYDNYYFYTEADEQATGNNRFTHHIEYVYHLDDPEALEDYHLWARMVKDGEIIDGSWEVSFVMGELDKITIKPDMEIAEELQITPISVYVEGYGKDPEKCEISMRMEDGTLINLSARNIFKGRGNSMEQAEKWNLNFVADKVMEPEKVEAVLIDGKEISVNVR